MAVKRVSIFSWGYWGWGNATRQLVMAMAAAERAHDFTTPIFVDIRYSRSVRAVGFRGPAFKTMLPKGRYLWMPSLGNSNIGTRRGGIRIASPKTAPDLLDLAVKASARSQRVIFFCSCESPWRTRACHRHAVANLLTEAARRRGIPVDIQEWPGGQPSVRALAIRVSPAALLSARRGATGVPLKGATVPAALAGLPWGTLVKLAAGRDEFFTVVGPAAYRQGRWVLPRFFQHDERSPAALRKQASALRNRYGLNGKRSPR